MKIRLILALLLSIGIAGCDPGQRYSVQFDAWDIGSPPTNRITVDTSQMGDAAWKKETEQASNRGGGVTVRDVYNVDRPIKIIIVPLDANTNAP